MKPSQRVIYAERIDKVLTHLAARLAEGVAPGLEELAGVAALSEYHFHRVFRLMTGETLSSTVQRLRLAISLSALTPPSATVGDASALGAYATSQSYARALKSRTGAAPTDAKSQAAEIARIREHLRRPAVEMSASGTASPLGVEIVSFEPLTIVAMRNLGDYAKLYDGYSRLIGLLPDASAVTGIYGVSYDDPQETPAQQCRFDCCVSLGNLNAAGIPGLRELHMKAAICLRVRQTGSYERTQGNLDSLYSYVLSNSEWSFGTSPPFIHYLDDPEFVRPEDLRADLYLPVMS